MQLCIFEDINYYDLEPLVFSRPVYDLICGINSLKEKILRNYDKVNYSLHCRPYLRDVVKKQNPGILINEILDNECLFINGRIIAPNNLSEILPLTSFEDRVFVNGETVVAAYLSGKNLENKVKHFQDLFSVTDFEGLSVKIVDISCANFIWDLTNHNGKQILEDYKYLKQISTKQNFVNKLDSNIHLVNKEQIFIGEDVTIKPGVVLDASSGPIVIDDQAFIYPNAVIEGPVYVGESARIKSGATIYENVSIGKACKVGGEIEDSVFMPFSNKQHSGFIGHAYIGSWVNLGADTNCSDLKNNYSKIKVTLSGKEVDSGLQFVGVLIGDHSKSAINTMFNTGTVIGFSCNIFGVGFPKKYIPSFSWGGIESPTSYDVNKAIETARIMMSRRKITFDKDDEILFKTIFSLTENDRKRRGI